MVRSGPPYASLKTYIKLSESDDSQQCVEQCKSGEVFQLLRVPDNPNDSNVIKVLTSDSHEIGHISNKIAKSLALLIDDGKTVNAIVSDISKFGDYYQCLIEISVDGVQWGVNKEPVITVKK